MFSPCIIGTRFAAKGSRLNAERDPDEHIGRHNVTPEEAQLTLTNEPMDFDYPIVKGEERWTSLGHTNKLRILKVAWAVRGDVMRVVTAVNAPLNEARSYLRAKTDL